METKANYFSSSVHNAHCTQEHDDYVAKAQPHKITAKQAVSARCNDVMTQVAAAIATYQILDKCCAESASEAVELRSEIQQTQNLLRTFKVQPRELNALICSAYTSALNMTFENK